MPIAHIEQILGKAVQLRTLLDKLPTPTAGLYEYVFFVEDYWIASGNTKTSPNKNVVKASVRGAEIKEGREFIDMADYWNFVCGILADRTKHPGWKVNAIFGFQYGLALHYFAGRQVSPEERALRVQIFNEVQSLIDEAIRGSPKDNVGILVAPEGEELAKKLYDYNCASLTDRIFTDKAYVDQIRDKFWPKCKHGLYPMMVTGRIHFAEPI
jgi:hypothetical protein